MLLEIVQAQFSNAKVSDMITKEGIEILFPWQLTIYKEVKAQVKQEVQEETKEARQEMQEARQEIQREARQEGIREGRAEGHIEERRKNARSMFSKGFSAHDIQDVTGLSEDEIRAFQQNENGKA